MADESNLHTSTTSVGARMISFIVHWTMTTNHKDIGTLYMCAALFNMFVGGLLALAIRAELFIPGLQIVNPNFYNTLTTMHGLIMLFGVLMPVAAGFANWQIPMMIGAPDMALPRINNMAFWLMPFATVMLVSAMFMDGGGPNFGWTMYAPLSTTYGPPSTDFMIFAIHMLGISSIMGAINIITTIWTMRAPGMTWLKLPMFVWTWLVTAFILLAIMPVLAGAVTMMLFDRNFGTSFFDAAGGGDPLLFQNLLWFFGHPEVYVLALPAFGVISEIIPTFSRKPLFGYRSMVVATVLIGFLSGVVWAHHMFTSGMPYGAQLYFMLASMLIAVPTGMKVFNWVATMFRGSLSFETPMLFAIAFVIMFTFAGCTGVMLAVAPADFQYHDSYFVVAHFHYVLVNSLLFAFFGAVYYWYPKWFGRMYNERLGQWHFWLSFISANVLFFPQHFLGLAGMPRRIPDYAISFTDLNMISSVGAFVFGFTQLLFAYNLVVSVRRGQKASAQVWEGAKGLEWTLSSPPPYHSFQTPPKIG